MGVGRALKENNPRIKIVCAHPMKGHYIQGLKNMGEAIVPSIYDPSLIDEILMVETEVAYEMAREIVKQEGIFVGMSNGAAMYESIEVPKYSLVIHFPRIPRGHGVDKMTKITQFN